MNVILKVRDFIEKIILGIAVIMLCLVGIFIGLQIFFRTIGIGIDWTEEFARFSFVGVTFLGSVIAITRNKHIVIDFLAVKLPDIARRCLLVVIHISMSGFMVVCIYGLSIIMRAARGVSSNTVIWFQMNYIFAVVMVGCILMGFASLLRALEYAVMKKDLPPAQGA
ncbi:MAG: TRAP transporter small permease subunit [Treponema sp.]|nr:TRAP transporter small permease subunit [Treponema sp.]